MTVLLSALWAACASAPSPAEIVRPIVLGTPVRLSLSGPERLLERWGYVDVSPLVMTVEGGEPGLLVQVVPGRSLQLVLVSLSDGEPRRCSRIGRPWTVPVTGYYLWGNLRRLPARVWFSDFGGRWAEVGNPACEDLGRYRLHAVLSTARAERVFVLPEDPWFDEAAEQGAAVVRRGRRGAPALVELPARGLVVDAEPITIWGTDLPPGQIAYTVSNGLDVELVDMGSFLPDAERSGTEEEHLPPSSPPEPHPLGDR